MNQTIDHELSAQMPSDAALLEQMRRTIAMVAHGLKTPLTGMKLFADLLLSQDVDAETRAKYLAVIGSEAERMGRMIANLVDYLNITGAGTEWHDEETDIVKLAAVCARPFQRWCAAKGIGFSYITDVERLVISVDADRIARLLSGLLANALRFTETGGVKLELRSAGATLRLAVSDSGPGISEEDLKQLFQPRVGAPNPGKDIGLAFARAVVDHYQGRIWAEGVVGDGSTFYVELPLRRGDLETWQP